MPRTSPHLARGEQRLGRARVHGGKHNGRGGAVGEQRVEEMRGRLARMQRVAVFGLGGEGVGGEPVEQLGAVARDHVDLRAVDVRVDEAGQHQPAAVVDALPALGRRLDLCAGDASFVVDQQPVVRAKAHRGRVDVAPRRGGGEVEQVAADADPHAGISRR